MNVLSLTEKLEAGSVNDRIMDEHIFSSSRWNNKTKASFFIKPLHFSRSHFIFLFLIRGLVATGAIVAVTG